MKKYVVISMLLILPLSVFAAPKKRIPPPPPPAPTVTITANPGAITLGSSSNLTWSSTNTTSCVASGGWSGPKAISGSQSVLPTTNTTYIITCIGSGGSVNKSITIVVNTLPPPTVPPSPPPPVPPATTMQIGAFTGDYYVWQSSFNALQTQVGQLDAQMVFTGFGDDFPNTSYLCPSKTLFNYWENDGYSLDGIILGNYDSLITLYANKAKAYSCPVIISIFHEMNGNWSSWSGTLGTNSPSKIISAWIHIRNIFNGVGATNVKFAWVVNNNSVPDTLENQIVNYYPGTDYVDIIGDDSFNFGGQTFAQVTSALPLLKTYGKPVWLSSVGSVAPQDQFVTDMLNVSDVSGILYFNYDIFTLTPSSLNIFKNALQSLRLNLL